MPHATRPGDVLGDRYRLVDLLAESKGGRFWRAHDPVLERHVAVHVIRGDDTRAPALMEAARHSAAVPDRRVLRVLDADCTDTECYVVNEWGWGTSLDIVAAGSGSLGPRRAAWLVSEVADSLAAAHAVGVAHGRLNPENVLVDRAGGVRIIGLCVDAALHGIDDRAGDAAERDLADLAGLLYCALTARWAGPSASIVPPAPRDHGEVLRPRQVRAGIPRPLDLLCEEVLHGSAGRHRELGDVSTSARGLADYLADYVGDPAGMPEALLLSTPDVLPEEEQVVLPPVPEVMPHRAAPLPAPPPQPPEQPEPQHRATEVRPLAGPPGERLVEPTAEPPAEPDDDRPTEAGVPIFGDELDDVSWLVRRTTPAPPPPPFEAPPERPLFAPEPTGGSPRRTPRQSPDATTGAGAGGRGARDSDGFWPWDTGTGASTGSSSLAAVRDEDEPVPGRGFLRLATAIAVIVLLCLGVVVAIGLSDDEGADDSSPVGGVPERADLSAAQSVRRPATPATPAAVLAGVVATAYDPQGDPPAENDDAAALAVDGDPTTSWTTAGYVDQLGGPRGLTSGVGLVLDLGGARSVDAVALTLDGTPTSLSLHLLDEPPTVSTTLDRLEPVAHDTADGPRLVLDAAGARGSHLVVWLTALPLDAGGRFRGSIAEVVVRGGVA